jgi:hypothetical protein
MTTITQLLTLFTSFLFAFLSAFTDVIVIQIYAFICFVVIGAMSVALVIQENK